MVSVVATIAIVIASIKSYAESHTTTPHVPLYPGAHIIDWPANGETLDKLKSTYWGDHKVDRANAFAERVLMETVRTPQEIADQYSQLLSDDNWADPKICRSGRIGTTAWSRSEGWPGEIKWMATVDYVLNQDYLGTDRDTTYIVVTFWRGSSLPRGVCSLIG